MNCVELFAGIGAMSLGLKKAGYRHILMVEKDAACVCTLENNGFENVLHADVREVNFYPANGVDLVAGGVPCQPFSNAGNRLGRDDPRDVWSETIRCVKECAPRSFMFENSAAMCCKRHVTYLDEIVSQFEGLGFFVSKFVVNAADYGVPQSRRRLLLIGHRGNESFNPPRASPRIDVRTALASLGSPPNLEIDGHVVHDGGRVYRGHGPSCLSTPSKALVAGAHGCGGGTNTLRLDDGSVRYFTPREMARLMTLPDDYVLPKRWSVCVKQLGNACPVELVRRFASRLATHAHA